MAATRRVGAYSSAIWWIAHNDDTSWLDDECGSPSVTLCLVADVFGRTVEHATADLRREISAERRARELTEQAQATARRIMAQANA